MPNGTYGGVRGKETKVGQKTFVSRPTRFRPRFSGHVSFQGPSLKPCVCVCECVAVRAVRCGQRPDSPSRVWSQSSFRIFSGRPAGRDPAGKPHRLALLSCLKDVFLRTAGRTVPALVSIHISQSKAGVTCTAGAQNGDAPGKMAS